MPKFTNKTKRSVFVPNPDFNADIPPGPLNVKMLKLAPGQSVENCPAEVAKALAPDALEARDKEAAKKYLPKMTRKQVAEATGG